MRQALWIAVAALVLGACQSAPSREALWSKAPPPEPVAADRPMPARLLLLPIDIRVHEISAGGVVEKVDAWSQRATQAANTYVRSLDERDDGIALMPVPTLSGEEQAALDQHVALYDVVAYTAYSAQRSNDPVWRKRGDDLDYTIGPGLGALADKSGADAALVIIGSDHISSTGRKAANVALTFVGALIGVAAVPHGGEAFVSAGVVDLRTGRLLWFDTHRSSNLDLDEEKGVKAVLDAIFKNYPGSRPRPTSDGKSG